MFILGINAHHAEAAACLLKDGKLLAAAQEERFVRRKYWAGFPVNAIRFCLEEAGIALGDVDHLAINRNGRANLFRKLKFIAGRKPSLSLLASRVAERRQWAGVREELEARMETAFTGTVHEVEHHLAHLASAYHVSPFPEAAVLSIDSFGDFASAAWGRGAGDRLTLEGQVHFPHSLGIFYTAMTQFLGFRNFGDEYKVMGLSPYGQPTFAAALRQVLRLEEDGTYALNLAFFRHHKEKVAYEADGMPVEEIHFSEALSELLGPPRPPDAPLGAREKDLAASTQRVFEEALFHLLDALHPRLGSDRLALAGGCANNSVANGKITRRTRFRELYVQCSASDSGGAIGAACHVWQKAGGRRAFVMDHGYWGPSFTDAEIAAILEGRQAELDAAGCSRRLVEEEELCAETAAAIAAGAVVGWFQGRMEWGPRALGNRSILGDPRRADMKDILNLKIKRRESFRPFAPSVLRDAVDEWFEQSADVPFMMEVFTIRPEKRPLIPAVTHVDGTGRLQTVHAGTNPRYDRLIRKFAALTGVPMVLNTSFNENEPVVCRPEEALDCFLRTRMDLLVAGNHLIRRHLIRRAS